MRSYAGDPVESKVAESGERNLCHFHFFKTSRHGNIRGQMRRHLLSILLFWGDFGYAQFSAHLLETSDHSRKYGQGEGKVQFLKQALDSSIDNIYCYTYIYAHFIATG